MKVDYYKRIDSESFVEESVYLKGLVDIVDFLVQELEIFLKEENRFFGLAKSYIDSIQNVLSNININVDDEEVSIFGKILYLYKPLISFEFKRLKSKKLSSGDSVICIIKKLTDIIYERDENVKGIKTIRKLIYKFFDNIRNKAKNDSLYFFSNFIKTNLKNGNIGIFESNSFSLKTNESITKEIFEGDNIKLEENENSVSEITWIGEK